MHLVSDKELNEASIHLAAELAGGRVGSCRATAGPALPSLNRGQKEEEVRPSWRPKSQPAEGL